LAESGASLSIREVELQTAQSQLDKQQVIEAALCAKVKELTTSGNSLSQTIRELEQRAQVTEQRVQDGRKELAALRYAILEASRLSGQLSREHWQAARQDMASLDSLVAALLNTPLSTAQRALAASLHDAIETAQRHQAGVLGAAEFRVDPPVFRASEFGFAEATQSAFQTVQRLAKEAGIEARTVIAGSVPEKLQGSAEHLHQLIALLTTSLLKLVETEAVNLLVSVEQSAAGPAQLALEVELHSNGHSEEACERLATLAANAGAWPTARLSEAESGVAVCAQLTRALDGQMGVESSGNGTVRVRASLPVQIVVPAVAVTRSMAPQTPEGLTGLVRPARPELLPAERTPAHELAEVA
jgi:hypothetical protein